MNFFIPGSHTLNGSKRYSNINEMNPQTLNKYKNSTELWATFWKKENELWKV